MVGRDKLDCVPLFLGELADDIFVCGKTVNLLKLCCPEVCLFQVVVFAPGIIHVFFCSSYGLGPSRCTCIPKTSTDYN